MFRPDLEKAEEPENKLPTSAESLKKQESSRKTSISVLLTTSMSLCRSQQTVENSSRDGNIRQHLNCLLRNLYADQEATVRERESYVCVCVCIYTYAAAAEYIAAYCHVFI